jgi:hypothetical protein
MVDRKARITEMDVSAIYDMAIAISDRTFLI